MQDSFQLTELKNFLLPYLSLKKKSTVNHFLFHRAKLGVGLLSGRYSFLTAEGSQAGVSPHMYRNLIGKGHPEFMSKRQQDAHEFYLHLLSLLQVSTGCSY